MEINYEKPKLMPETSEGSFEFKSPRNMKKKNSYIENKKGNRDNEETRHYYRSNKTMKYKEKDSRY